MKTAIVFTLIFASALTVSIIKAESNNIVSSNDALLAQPQMVKNLQISNYTGSEITSDMVSVFVRVINDAYTFYRDNVSENAQYIQSKLEGSYSGKCQVLIFSENSTADLRIYSLGGGSYVTWSKVNTGRPAWSYIIAILSTTTLQKKSISGFYERGNGVGVSLEKVIQNTIARYETGKNCSCSTFLVGYDLENFDGQRWNVVCSSPKGTNGGFSGFIYQKDGIYLQTIQFTDGKCRYLVWVI